MLSDQSTCAPSQELSTVLPGSTAVFRCQLCQHEHYVDREALSLPYSASFDLRTAHSALHLGSFNVKLQQSSNASFVHTHTKYCVRMRLVAPQRTFSWPGRAAHGAPRSSALSEEEGTVREKVSFFSCFWKQERRRRCQILCPAFCTSGIQFPCMRRALSTASSVLWGKFIIGVSLPGLQHLTTLTAPVRTFQLCFLSTTITTYMMFAICAFLASVTVVVLLCKQTINTY